MNSGRRNRGFWTVAGAVFILAAGLFVAVPTATVATNGQALNDASTYYAGGPSSYSGACADCHSADNVPFMTLSGPASVAPGSTNTYSLVVSGGQQDGNLDISIAGSVIDSGGTNVQILGQEQVHLSTGMASRAGKVALSFDWTAPDAPGDVIMYGVGRALSGGGSGEAGKASVASLAISVEGE